MEVLQLLKVQFVGQEELVYDRLPFSAGELKTDRRDNDK